MYVHTPRAGQHAQSYVDSSGAQFRNCQDGGKRRGAKKTTDPKRGQCGERGAHVAIGRSAGHRFNRFISMLNYAPRYFPSRDFRLP